MKSFTKVALIIALILVVLGSTFCMIGLGIGFSFRDFWEDVEMGEFSIGPFEDIPYVIGRNNMNWKDDGKSWKSSSTERFDFIWQGDKDKDRVDQLEVDVYYGTVVLEENSEDDNKIFVTVEYRKKDHKRQVKAYKDGATLKIEEIGSKRSFNNDSTKIMIQIPSYMMEMNEAIKELSLKQGAGDIYVNLPLRAEKINISVDAGECEVAKKLTALEKCQADVGAGQINFEEIEAKELELKANVGQIDTEEIKADQINIDCGIGSIDILAAGKEQDYNYEVECSVGEVEIGDNSFSGLGSKRKIENAGDKQMQVKCNVGQVDVSFSEED